MCSGGASETLWYSSTGITTAAVGPAAAPTLSISRMDRVPKVNGRATEPARREMHGEGRKATLAQCRAACRNVVAHGHAGHVPGLEVDKHEPGAEGWGPVARLADAARVEKVPPAGFELDAVACQGGRRTMLRQHPALVRVPEHKQPRTRMPTGSLADLRPTVPV